MAPLHRRRRRRNRFFGVLFFIFILWLVGVRVHLESFASLVPHRIKAQYWNVELNDGTVIHGKVLNSSKDALTIVSRGEKRVLMSGQIKTRTPMTEEQIRIAMETTEIKHQPCEPFITFRKEDNLFFPLMAELSRGPKVTSAGAGGMAEMASKMSGVSESKIRTMMSDPSKITPEQIKKYQDKMQAKLNG